MNSVDAKCPVLSVFRGSIAYLWLIWLRQIFDLLATDKLLYFAQPRSMIVDSRLSGVSVKAKRNVSKTHTTYNDEAGIQTIKD